MNARVQIAQRVEAGEKSLVEKSTWLFHSRPELICIVTQVWLLIDEARVL